MYSSIPSTEVPSLALFNLIVESCRNLLCYVVFTALRGRAHDRGLYQVVVCLCTYSFTRESAYHEIHI